MPMNIDELRGLVRTLIQDRELDRDEVTQILQDVAVEPAQQEKIDAVLEELGAAYGQSRLELDTGAQRAALERLLDSLAGCGTLALDQGGTTRPDGSVNWVDAFIRHARPAGPELPRSGYHGEVVAVAADGALSCDGAALDLRLTDPAPALVSALLALNRPGQLEGLEPATAKALAADLLAALEAASPIDADAANQKKFGQVVAATAALGALAELGPRLDSAAIDALLRLYPNAPASPAKALLGRALERAPLGAAQRSALEALSLPADRGLLLETWDNWRGDAAQVRYLDLKPPAQPMALSILAFAKDQAAVGNIYTGLEVLSHYNQDYRNAWDTEEVERISKLVQDYVQSYGQIDYVFGTFSTDAPKNLAQWEHARDLPEIEAALGAAPPTLGGTAVTPAQAERLRQLLPLIRNADAAKRLGQALADAGTLFGAPRPPVASRAPAPAAFELFMRQAAVLVEQVEGSADGMLDAAKVAVAVREELRAVNEGLRPGAGLSAQLQALAASPPSFGGVALSPEAARFLRELLENSLRSVLSVENLITGVEVIAAHHGGALTSPEATQDLQRVIGEYRAEWPHLQFLDFNKLGRIAGYRVRNEPVPACRINGQTVSFADLYAAVGKAVAANLDKEASALRHDWQIYRAGWRAKAAAELLDVIAQQCAEGRGPVVALQQRFPGKAIAVRATGLDGGHQQFLYQVEGEGLFAQGSDGTVAAYTGQRAEPVLFTATVHRSGAFDVQVDRPLVLQNKYLLQTTYDVGDSIDVPCVNEAVTADRLEEGQPFQIREQVVEGTVKGYTAAGDYVVSYLPPGAEARVEKTLPLADIRKHNQPHFFPLRGSYYSDLGINIEDDATLKDFIEQVKRIALRYLPDNDSLLELSPQELAKRQKQALKELVHYIAHDWMEYPREMDAHPDDLSRRYHELHNELWRIPFGKLLEIRRGVCRDQNLALHLACQVAGIDSRLGSGAANTAGGNYRGLHIWMEVALADNARYLADQTWGDAYVPLWSGAYGVDRRRIEMAYRTARFDDFVVS